jgi:mono/diheme cytochrome c family protein
MRNVIVISLVISAAAVFACFESGPPDESNVATGEALVGSLACASCHGADLSGSESPIGKSGAYAANLTPDPATGLGNWTDDDVARAIRTGVDDGDASLCSVMPRFGTLASDQTDAIVAYLRSLAPIAHDIPESDCDPQPDLDDGGLDDAGVVIVTDDAPSCTGYADPQQTADCHACSGSTCQHNGCYGGWYCELATLHCVPKPSGCD